MEEVGVGVVWSYEVGYVEEVEGVGGCVEWGYCLWEGGEEEVEDVLIGLLWLFMGVLWIYMGGICFFYGIGVFLDIKRGMYYLNVEGYLCFYKWVYFVMICM